MNLREVRFRGARKRERNSTFHSMGSFLRSNWLEGKRGGGGGWRWATWWNIERKEEKKSFLISVVSLDDLCVPDLHQDLIWFCEILIISSCPQESDRLFALQPNLLQNPWCRSTVHLPVQPRRDPHCPWWRWSSCLLKSFLLHLAFPFFLDPKRRSSFFSDPQKEVEDHKKTSRVWRGMGRIWRMENTTEMKETKKKRKENFWSREIEDERGFFLGVFFQRDQRKEGWDQNEGSMEKGEPKRNERREDQRAFSFSFFFFFVFGGPKRKNVSAESRSRDLPRVRRMLYRLSYRNWIRWWKQLHST